MKKRFVLSGYFGFKNFGDEAILSVLVNKLKENRHRVTVISSDPEYTKSKFNHILSVYTFNIYDIIGVLLKSDYLISGGGSLLQDATSFKSLIYYLFIIFLALIFGKKVIIFAQGIGPIKNPIGKLLSSIILKYCTYVSVRDIKSLDLVKSWGVNAELVCDPIFSTQIKQDIEKTNTVAIQLRDFKTLNEDFIDRLAAYVLKNFSDKNIDIYSFQDSIDLEVCNKFKHSLELLNPTGMVRVLNNLTDNEIINGIASAEYLIGMRFHSIIIGLISGTKTLPINYDIKIEKLAKEFELPILDLHLPFENQFKTLKTQDLKKIETILLNNKFDWSGFEATIAE